MALVPDKANQSTQIDSHIPVRNEWELYHTLPVVPSDTVLLPVAHTVALIAGVAGVAKVVYQDGSNGLLPLAAGIPTYVDVKQVFATGTTATGIVAAYG